MIAYYLIPLALMDTVRELINSFEGYVCITAIEPTTPPEELDNIQRTPTGINGQTGELQITADCKCFCLEGNLQQFGYRDIAMQLGCIEFQTAEDFKNYIQTTWQI